MRYLSALPVLLLLAPPAMAEGPSLPLANRPAATLSLSAVLGQAAAPLRANLRWRIFLEAANPDGSHALVAESAEAAPVLALPDGQYIVHVAWGLAAATRRTVVRGASTSERLALNAGGLKIIARLGEAAVPPARIDIAVYVPVGSNLEAKLVLDHGKPGDTIALPEGSYHIVSTYLDAGGAAAPTNSVVAADLKVATGKLTEATLRHRAATPTLKLVNAQGGDALANTSFTVLTPGGDVIRELIGAFPSLVLAEGEYVAIARHDGKAYQQTFKVESGADRDVEILVK